MCIAGATALATTLTACGDKGGGAAGGCNPISSSVTVSAQDALKLDAATYDAKAGCIEFTYKNQGSLAHTLLVKDQPGFKLAIGDTDTGTITLDAGTYTVYCDIAGHEKAGMKAELTVT